MTILQARRTTIPNENRIVVGHGPFGRSIYTPARQSRCVLLVGPSQSGKTSAGIVNNLLQWRGPVITASTKGDVLLATYQKRLAQGPVYVLDFAANPTPLPDDVVALRWTPTHGCADFHRALLRAHSLTDVVGTGDSSAGFFNARALECLAPLLCAAARGGRTLSELLGWVRSGVFIEPLRILDLHPECVDASAMLQQIENAHDKQKGDILGTVLAALKAYRGRRLVDADNPTPWNPEALLTESGTLYLIVPMAEADYAAPPCTAVLEELYDACRSLSESRRGPMTPRCLAALDEVANIAPVNLEGWSSECVGRGWVTLAAVQSAGQLRKRYGEGATTIIDNMRTIVLWGGVKDAEFLQTLAGLSKTTWDERRGHVPTLTSADLFGIPFGCVYIFGNDSGRSFRKARFAPARGC